MVEGTQVGRSGVKALMIDDDPRPSADHSPVAGDQGPDAVARPLGWRLVRRASAVVAFGYLGLVVGGWLFQDQLIFQSWTAGAAPPVAEVLADGEEVVLETDDGLSLRGWFLPARPTNGANGSGGAADTTGEPARPAPTVVFFPGSAGNLEMHSLTASALADRGFSVLIIEYRGYGGNPGEPSEEGLVLDGLAAVSYVVQRPDVDPERVIYLGESLGTGVAVQVAAAMEPAALILRSPYTAITDIPRERIPFLPYDQIVRSQMRTIDVIGEVDAPLLVVTGGSDGLIPPHQSRAVFDAAGSPVEYVEFAGLGHIDIEFAIGDRYLAEIEAHVDEFAGPPGG